MKVLVALIDSYMVQWFAWKQVKQNFIQKGKMEKTAAKYFLVRF